MYEGVKFQPTHPHGVRRLLLPLWRIRPGFNPRTRTGCDVTVRCREEGEEVSTHAPARGATRPPRGINRHPERFNPRTRTGCDLEPKGSQKSFGGQPTPPRVRRISRSRNFSSVSAHPHGVRQLPAEVEAIHSVQPTRTGATVSLYFATHVPQVSTHAPARGAT